MSIATVDKDFNQTADEVHPVLRVVETPVSSMIEVPRAAGLRDLVSLLQGRAPGQLVIQFTDHCNALCPQCGMRVANRFLRTRLDSNTIRKTIDAAAEKGVKALSFTGGEPMLFASEVAGYVRYAHRAGIPAIRTGTNGFFFANPDRADFESRVKKTADLLCSIPLRNFWISLDSAAPEVHERMRGFPGLIKGIEKALPWFHERGLYPSANLGLNRNVGGDAPSNLTMGLKEGRLGLAEFERDAEEALRSFYRRVLDLGFTMANTCYPMSIEPEGPAGELTAVYTATSADRVVRFSIPEKAALFRALKTVVKEHRSKIRIFTPLCSLDALIRYYEGETETGYSCRGGIDNFFVDAVHGDTFPCGYRGEECFGKFRDLDPRRIDRKAHCRRCDWECFRDPSELFGPIIEGLQHPLAMIRKTLKNPTQMKQWSKDLSYYRACGFFDSRIPPNHHRLSRF